MNFRIHFTVNGFDDSFCHDTPKCSREDVK